MTKKKIVICLIYVIIFSLKYLDLYAQRDQPSEAEMLDRYRLSAFMDKQTQNKVLNEKIIPYWSKQGHYFCYERQLQNGKCQYRLVYIKNGKNAIAFNHVKLANLLSEYFNYTYHADSLSLIDLVYDETKHIFSFFLSNKSFICDYSDEKGLSVLTKKENNNIISSDRGENRHFLFRDSLSPNKEYMVSTNGGNVFIKNLKDGSIRQYSYDGSSNLPYDQFSWSPDSKHLVGFHIHPVVDSNVYYILSAVPNTTRGVLKSHPYKQPGDPFTSYEMHLFDVGDQKNKLVHTDIIDFSSAPLIHWDNSSAAFTYERFDRGHQRFRIISVNVHNTDTFNVVDEKTKTFIYQNRVFTYYLPKSEEIIRTSEKDGWQQLYLIDRKTRNEKRITNGNWVVRSVDSIDESRRQIWFSASGMSAAEDPYNIHYYRIGFDGTNLVSLTPEIGNHTIVFSPDRKSFIDNYSQINVAPISLLRNSMDGHTIANMEIADISPLLATGVSLPEPFAAKGRDGKTDIYGIMLKPSHFDKNKKYPVLENIYAGPHDSFVPKNFLGYSEMQSIAELGFIVVYIDGMGTANRSKAFHDVCWHNLQDAGFPDRILWIKALSEKYSFVDTNRVGIYGTSAGGQDALCALLTHPEFYKAGVAACGCHDNRIDKQWWNEQWMGYPVGPWYNEQSNVTNAFRLKGRLMLVVGDADTNVPPESTYRVADALIKAGKDFDFLPVPGENHTDGGPYGRMKTKDFFVKELIGASPPNRNNNEEFTLPNTGRRPSKVI